MLRSLRPQKLIVLGDLLHARVAEARELLRQVQAWRRKWSELEIILVSGNHDRRAGRPPDAFGIDQVVEAYPAGPFTFRHRPRGAATAYVIAGHIHPAVRVRGVGRQKETLPCFYFGPRYGLLPAFGGFTGTHVLTPERGSRLFAVAEDEIIELSPAR
jgi:DNA ligase-associated metallophosphoesterase